MASPSGNSSGSSCGTHLIQNNSATEEDLQELMDQRKRKRQQSNRESARRSRMRKRKHLDDLMAQVTQLSKDNKQILTSINITTQHCMNIETENSILRAQLMQLSQRLQSLTAEILNLVNTTDHHDHYHHHHPDGDGDDFTDNNGSMYLNQPIMA